MATTTVKCAAAAAAALHIRVLTVRTATTVVARRPRFYHASSAGRLPTAMARAERAADLKAHPEAAVAQEKVEDRPHNRHWSEDKATVSEADIHADREARAEREEMERKAQQSK